MTVVAPATPARAPEARTSKPVAVLGAMLALLCLYGLLSLADDPRGTLGTDTGGKLATLATMDRNGSLDPDLGYWARELDPSGSLHPLFYTNRVGDRWVNVTTLPMVVVADPLYALGGPRLVLALPMLGAALAALAARALTRRIAGGDGWWAFWTVGLASPIAIYALDFWEHAPGVALVMWGIVFAFDVADERAGWRAALVSGVCFGAAATMRTEALVYAAVTVAVLGWSLGSRVARSAARAAWAPWRRVATIAASWAAGVLVALVANQLLERVVAGGSIRAGRAVGTAATAGDGTALRVKEALTTAVGLNRFEPTTDWCFGALAVALVAYSAWRLTAPGRGERLLGVVALAAASLLYVVRFADGLGFVPGVLSASPLAAAGVAIGWSARRWRPTGVIALAALPVVWLFQFSGGANPQWGGRYTLTTGTLLVVGAAVVLAATPGVARVVLVALAVAVTAAGIGWLSARSHAVAHAMRSLQISDDTVLVSREPHLLREGGAFYRPDQRWLTATSPADLERSADIADAVDAARLEVVAVAGRREPDRIGPYERASQRRLEFLPGLDVVVATYAHAGTG